MCVVPPTSALPIASRKASHDASAAENPSMFVSLPLVAAALIIAAAAKRPTGGTRIARRRNVQTQPKGYQPSILFVINVSARYVAFLRIHAL